jgi:mannose/cellobiose epimerase-like protein (N-acyl-D-glucosamine 2-epimerase family)
MNHNEGCGAFSDQLHTAQQHAGSTFTGYLLPQNPAQQDLLAAVKDYEIICATNIRAVLERFERHGGSYPFVDTKLDLQTGQDFDSADIVRGRDTIYGWIQGRGLESLAGHAQWAQRHHNNDIASLSPRLRAMEQIVLDSVQRLRAVNDGHLFFFMKPDGVPFVLAADGDRTKLSQNSDTPSGYSDLFGAKGLFAAARDLENTAVEAEAREWLQAVADDILQRRFASDQQPLDPTNPIEALPGRHGHGPYMIQLGASALAAAAGDAAAIDEGLTLIEHELSIHANVDGRLADFEEGDFWEFVGDDNMPLRLEDGSVLCDPGHALEFVGLAYKFLRAARNAEVDALTLERLSCAAAPLPTILQQIFRLGFQPHPGGICKAYDMVGRRPLHTDMPWWSLPETIRSAALCWQESDDADVRQSCLGIWRDCHNAFVENYLRPEIHLMAIQTLNIEGTVSPAIPATADADPGYHTGLSLLDVIDLFRD